MKSGNTHASWRRQRHADCALFIIMARVRSKRAEDEEDEEEEEDDEEGGKKKKEGWRGWDMSPGPGPRE